MKYILNTSFVCILLSTSIVAQDCVQIELKSGDACLKSVRGVSASLKQLQQSTPGTLESAFYQYFAGTDYQGYKQMFLPTDWYGLTPSEFDKWRQFVRSADINILAIAEATMPGNKEYGIVKYTYVMEDQLLYETFLAKKTGTQWRPTSSKEDQDNIQFTNFIRLTNTDYLSSLTAAARNTEGATSPHVEAGKVSAGSLSAERDSLRIYHPDTYQSRYNEEFVFRTKDKWNADRMRDTDFIAFLTENALTPEQVDIVMKYIHIQDYLGAAHRADQFSEVTYTYMPFVEKIREIYGKDRIRRWDSENKTWD